GREFNLSGERLSGGWRLLRMRGRNGRDGSRDDGRDNWLLMKRGDEAARGQTEFDVTEQQPESVKSGKRLGSENDAPAKRPVKHRQPVRRSARRVSSQALDPADYPLALATLVKEPPAGKQWTSEIKFHGYRLPPFLREARK